MPRQNYASDFKDTPDERLRQVIWDWLLGKDRRARLLNSAIPIANAVFNGEEVLPDWVDRSRQHVEGDLD